jgi:glutathione S-transferase
MKAQKTWIALEYSGIPYQLKEVGLYGAGGKPDWFMEMNPEGTVPVLSCYGGLVVIPDSESILEYMLQGKLEGPDGNTLMLPKDHPQIMATTVNDWRSFLSKDLLPVGKSAVLGSSASKKELDSLLAQKAKDIKGPYLCGDAVSVADCAAFPFLWRINDKYGLDNIKGCAKWAEWLKKCNTEPAFAKTVQTSWWRWW